ncbi:hypothetical protein F4604DRAFT_379071 [Suillus subluteus]|nr:hypothetical protein F4604DRAFT_379071 [Suillus subluteus]
MCSWEPCLASGMPNQRDCFPPPFPVSSSLFWTATHTGGFTPKCLANDCVVHVASSAQHSGGVLPSVPLATSAMDDYTVFAPGCGFIECNLSSFIVSRLEDAHASNDSIRLAQVLTLTLYDHHLLLDFPYTWASSLFFAAVQFYARSSQVDTTQVWFYADAFGGYRYDVG